MVQFDVPTRIGNISVSLSSPKVFGQLHSCDYRDPGAPFSQNMGTGWYYWAQ